MNPEPTIFELSMAVGRRGELLVGSALADIFGEEFVHPQRYHHSESSLRFDFYVFSPGGNFGVEVMTRSTISDLTPRGVARFNSTRISSSRS